MRRWLSDCCEYFRTLKECRARLLKNTRNLSAISLFSRIWDENLYWICIFMGTAIQWASRNTFRFFERGYCRVADRLFGGDRCLRYSHKCERLAKAAHAKVRMLRSEQFLRDSEHFNWYLATEAHTNPAFTDPTDEVQ
jgi:hypothetical protein